MSDIFALYGPPWSRDSARRGLMVVPEPRIGTKADGASAIKALVLFNNLLKEIRLANSIQSCKSPLRRIFIQ